LLATLEGEFPSKADLPDIDLNKFSLPIDLPVSLPSDLVNQRPDILAAEAQMHVASAKIGVATALMFPSFSLNGTFGTSGTNFGNLTASSGKFWSIGPVATILYFRVQLYGLAAKRPLMLINSHGQIIDRQCLAPSSK
jgi:outer membrane protein TolC